MRNKLACFLVAFNLAFLGACLVGCEGPAEDVGEKIDETTEDLDD